MDVETGHDAISWANTKVTSDVAYRIVCFEVQEVPRNPRFGMEGELCSIGYDYRLTQEGIYLRCLCRVILMQHPDRSPGWTYIIGQVLQRRIIQEVIRR